MKKKLYPKTKRIGKERSLIQITEKLDGSNCGFFHYVNDDKDDLLIATRNNIVFYSEPETHEGILYKGMKEWLDANAIELKTSLHPNSGFFGEWIGMGCLKYPDFDKKVYMFAKANITKDFEVTNIYYNHELFKYPFIDQNIPEFIGTIPLVTEYSAYPTIDDLDFLYHEYSGKIERNVEGFVINNNNSIKKYVRMKNGKLTPHKT